MKFFPLVIILFFSCFLLSTQANAQSDSTTWLTDNVHTIESLTTEDYSDLEFLKPLLDGKRIAQLGESAHGVSEYNQIKVRLIKYLHRELGYNVIAFESGFFGCESAYSQIDNYDATGLMKECIFGVWWAKEVLPLFEYIKQTQNTDTPLRLTGFDVQSDNVQKKQRATFIKDMVQPFDADKAREIFVADTTMIGQQGEHEAERYDSIAVYIGNNLKDIAVAANLSEIEVSLAAQYMRSEAIFQRQIALDFGPERTATRDKGMAENLEFILTELYPGEKVITWGHNFHLRHKNSEVQPYPGITMGEFMAEEWRDQMYTIGLYMGGGKAALNNREPYEITDIDTLKTPHVETIFSSLNEPVVFLDLDNAKLNDDNRWIFQPTSALSWGLRSITFTPKEQYDAILFIREVSPPEYIEE